MPKFPKNTDYKMKGSQFYGLGSSSPAKISDTEVVAAQKELDKVQLDFREPGWTQLARGIHKAALGPLGKFADKEKAKSSETEGTPNVQEIAEKNIKIEEETPANPLDDPNQGPVFA
jgi:hypothetical protein